ncbi:TPA: RNA-binding protein, partial [Enterococcus faecalis]|nr:RNA-binding protein [Enterococcus faecalis]
MNKQEFIETLEEIRANINRNAEISDYTDFSRGKKDAYNNAIGLAKQIDEPEKVVVPKFVAEWLDKHKYSTDIIDLFLSVEYATDSDGFVAEKW